MSEQDPRQGLRRVVALCAFAVGFFFFYFVSTAVPTPLLWHLPLERRFTFEVRPLALGADFYGRVLFSLCSGGAAWAVARLAVGALEPEALRRWLRLVSLWALSLLVFTAGLYVYLLASRQPIPAPLPPGYVAR